MNASATLHDQASALRQLMTERATPCVPAAAVPAPVPAPAPRRAGIYAIASGKGGVGKTSIALNLALVLARRGRRVALIDADLGTANVDVMLNMKPLCDLAHVADGRRTIEEVAIPVRPNLRVVPGVSGVASLADLGDLQRARLIDGFARLEREHDLLLIDCGAGVSRNVLGFVEAADVALVATTPEPTALTDAYALVKLLCRGPARPEPALVVNMAASDADARRTAERLAAVAARFLGTPVECFGHIPRDHHVVEAVLRRRPLVEAFPRCPAAAGVAALATRILSAPGSLPARPGFFRRVLGIFD